MKTIRNIAFSVFLLILSPMLFAQNIEKWHELDAHQQKEFLDKLSPKERMELFRKTILQEVVQSLKIPQEKVSEFSDVYSEYQLKIHAVKTAYPMQKNISNLSEEEAQKTLENSFIVGGKLLEIRREYAKKFQEIIPTNKVLQLFRYEGSIRKKMMEKREKYHHK